MLYPRRVRLLVFFSGAYTYHGFWEEKLHCIAEAFWWGLVQYELRLLHRVALIAINFNDEFYELLCFQ
jgi:hypothetical protein